MIKWAGRMGWSESQFWNTTPSFFYQCLLGHQEQERDRATIGLSHARLVAYWSVIAHLDKSAHLKLTDIALLPWETAGPQFEEVDPEELAKFSEQADRAIKNYHATQT